MDVAQPAVAELQRAGGDDRGGGKQSWGAEGDRTLRAAPCTATPVYNWQWQSEARSLPQQPTAASRTRHTPPPATTIAPRRRMTCAGRSSAGVRLAPVQDAVPAFTVLQQQAANDTQCPQRRQPPRAARSVQSVAALGCGWYWCEAQYLATQPTAGSLCELTTAVAGAVVEALPML